MKAIINSGGKLAEPIKMKNGVKYGDIPAPMVFSLHFAMVFKLAFKGYCSDVYIRYGTFGKLFNNICLQQIEL